MRVNKFQYTLSELTRGLEVTIKGDPHCLITGVSVIQQAQPGHITFLTNSLYRKHLAATQATAVILSEKDAEICNIHAVVCANPHYIYAKIAEFFAFPSINISGIHRTVVIGVDSRIDKTASIGAHCVIGNQVSIAKDVVIGPGCVIGDGSSIGEATQLDASVTIYNKVAIGKRTHITSGAVIGSDGFGFANQKGVWHKIPQLGGVQIGDDVDIGANTTIDCGAVDDTIIENGVKLDNLIQIGHNVKIREHTIIAGCTGIAGSAVIGKHCMIGGAAMIQGHIHIADHVMITGNTGVNKSILESGVYSSGVVGVVTNQEFKKNNARFHRLENLTQRIKLLESSLKELKEEQNK